MVTPIQVTSSLKRLCELERERGKSAKAAKADILAEIDRLRSIIPAFILAHHDRKLQQGKPSIVPVINGVCSACHLRLPSGHVAGLQTSQDLEVCDNCGTFIFLGAAPEPVASGEVKKTNRGSSRTPRKGTPKKATQK